MILDHVNALREGRLEEWRRENPGVRLYLTGANLKSAYLKGANLTGAYLTGANLTDAYLAGADLTGAYLAGADLTDADLTGANLTGADLTDAYLAGADLTGANLTGAVGIILIIGLDYELALRAGAPWMVAAGCRWFTVEEARTHWSDANERYADERQHFDVMRAKLEAAIAIAGAAGWPADAGMNEWTIKRNLGDNADVYRNGVLIAWIRGWDRAEAFVKLMRAKEGVES
jgi:uncharacterized protein YjbI with pentapeptide repeats